MPSLVDKLQALEVTHHGHGLQSDTLSPPSSDRSRSVDVDTSGDVEGEPGEEEEETWDDEGEPYCYCQHDGLEGMIQCSGEECSTEWVRHIGCFFMFR